MSDNLDTTFETPETEEGVRRANPSWYIDRKSSTILMIIKLAEGLSKLCLAILGAIMLQSVVSALNRIFQEGSTVADGKAMVAQFLKTLRVPAESIKQVVDAFPLDITFSSKPVVYVFIICLPFVVIAVLEAIAAIRLRLGKGGTRTIGILQMIYYIIGAIKLLAFVLVAIGLSVITIFRMGGTPSIILSTVYISLAVFFTIIGLPELFYHRSVAKIMDDVRYEMQTGNRAAHRRTHFQKILIILIVLEVIGVFVSVAASWSPEQGGLVSALLIGAMIGPAAKLLKYICVMCCHRNFMSQDSAPGSERSISHTPLFILIVLVILFFAVPNVVLCMQSSRFSTIVVEKVEEFFSDARKTVDEVSTVAEVQIAAVESAVAAQTGAGTADASSNETKEETAGTAGASQAGTNEETAGTTGTNAPQQDAAKEAAEESAAAQKTV